LANFDGEDVVRFVQDTRMELGYGGGLALYCDGCDEECSVAIEVEGDEGFVYLCEACLERALGMLRDSP
jgi:hypothetical protein